MHIIYYICIMVGNSQVKLRFLVAMTSLYQSIDHFGVLFRLLSVKLTCTNPNRSLSEQNLCMIMFYLEFQLIYVYNN